MWRRWNSRDDEENFDDFYEDEEFESLQNPNDRADTSHRSSSRTSADSFRQRRNYFQDYLSKNKSNGTTKEEEEDDSHTTNHKDNLLRVGDHVYVWDGMKSQRHGIVLESPVPSLSVASQMTKTTNHHTYSDNNDKTNNNDEKDNDSDDDDDDDDNDDEDEKDDEPMDMSTYDWNLITIVTFYPKEKHKNYRSSSQLDNDISDDNNSNRGLGASIRSSWKRRFGNNNNDDDDDDADDNIRLKEDDEEDDEKLIVSSSNEDTKVNLQQRSQIQKLTLRQFVGTSTKNTSPTTTTSAASFDFGSGTTTTNNKNTLEEQQQKEKEVFELLQKVKKVKYNVSRSKRILSYAGTTTCIPSDPQPLVMERLKHLIDHCNTLLPPRKNKYIVCDECAIVWCQTGKWITLQGASILEIVSTSSITSAIVAAGVVSQTTVTYAYAVAPGLLWIWSVPLTVAFPILVPILIAYGLTSLIPFEILRRSRKQWNEISQTLNKHFWEHCANEELKLEFFASTQQPQPDTNENGRRRRRFLGMFGSKQQQHTSNEEHEQNNINIQEEYDDQNATTEDVYMPLNMNGDDDDDPQPAPNNRRRQKNVQAVSTGRQLSKRELLVNNISNLKEKLNNSSQHKRKNQVEEEEKEKLRVQSLWKDLKNIELYEGMM